MKKKVFSSGFTLVEVLVSLTILGVLFGFGLSQYQRFNRHQIFVQSGERFKNNLRLAQSKAVAGEKPAQCAADSLEGYKLTFTNVNEYEILALCKEGGSFLSRAYKLSGDGEVTCPSRGEVTFKSLTGFGDQETIFTLAGFGETQRVVVTTSGEIRIQEV